MFCLKISSSNLKIFILFLFLLLLNLVKSNNLCFKEDNPPEGKRSYSSVYLNEPIGTGHARSMLDSLQAWGPATPTAGQWANINLEKEKVILGIITQKRYNHYHYTKTYNVKYSSDNINFIDTQKTYNGVLTNPSDQNQKFYDYIPFHIRAQYVKVYPLTYSYYPDLRVGILINSEEYIKTNCIPLQNNVFYDEVNKIIKPCSTDSTVKCGVCTSDSLPNYERTKCILKITTEKYILVNNYFHSCDVSCRTCETSTINCTQCNISDKYYKLSDNPNTCRISSPPGYYFDNLSESHKNCDVSCETCVDTANKCLICKLNYFPLIDQPNTCKILQTDGYYFNASIQKWSLCDISCRTCLDSPTNCTECNYNDNYFPLANDKSTCKKDCADFYFKNFIERQCSICDKSCKKCLDNRPICQVFL